MGAVHESVYLPSVDELRAQDRLGGELVHDLRAVEVLWVSEQVLSVSPLIACLPCVIALPVKLSPCDVQGLVYVEAAASGLPVVGTNEWAMPDIVINGKTGVLTQERSPEVLAKAMYQVLKNPDEAKKMGDAAIIHVDEVLDWPNVADRIIAAISPELLENRRPNWLPEDIDRPEIV